MFLWWCEPPSFSSHCVPPYAILTLEQEKRSRLDHNFAVIEVDPTLCLAFFYSNQLMLVVLCCCCCRQSLAVAYWLLARMVLEMRGTLPKDTKWDVLPDIFMYR